MKKLIIKNKPKKKFLTTKTAFFTFLIMAVIVIWLGAYNTDTSTENKIHTTVSTKEIQTPSKETKKELQKINEEELINEIQETFETVNNTDKLSYTPPKDNEKDIITYIALPLSGEISKEFSDTELIYSKTMNDYRTHSGIDIKADIGSDVCSPQNGRITEISKDEHLGYTITIDHGNMKSKISNLSSKIDLKVGDKVNLGQKIAISGDSAEYEISDPPHIHYELIVNGVNVNPLEYIE